MKYIIYCRKSTDEDDKQILSLSAQSRICNDFVTRNNYSIVEELHESASAKKAGRVVFNEVIEKLENNKADGVICHKEDRLTRNFTDTAKINELMDKGKEFLFTTGSYANNAQGKLMFNIMTSTAKWYVDNLSEETKKGLDEKIEQGGWAGWAPTGYLNNREIKTIELDPESAPYVKKAFERMATNIYSLRSLCEKLNKEGFRSRTNKELSPSSLYCILTNPFYYGMMRWRDELKQGNHPPIVSRTLWEEAQRVLNRKGKAHPSKYLDFIYRGLLVCGECGCKITAETQKGHTYYRCTKSKGGASSCSQKYIREEDLEKEISEGLRIVSSIDYKRLNWIKNQLKMSHQEEIAFREQSVSTLNRLLIKNRERQDKVLDMRIDGELDKDIYERKIQELRKEEADIHSKLNNHTKANLNWFENAVHLLDLSHRAHTLFLEGNGEQKKLLLSAVSTNLVLKDKKVKFEYKKPFDILVQGLTCSNWLRTKDTFRTLDWDIIAEEFEIFQNCFACHL